MLILSKSRWGICMNEYLILGFIFLIISGSMHTISRSQSDEAKKRLTFASVGFLIGGLIIVFSQLL